MAFQKGQYTGLSSDAGFPSNGGDTGDRFVGTDTTSALDAAMVEAMNRQVPLLIPAGIYRVLVPVDTSAAATNFNLPVDANYVHLKGEGPDRTIILVDEEDGCELLIVATSGDYTLRTAGPTPADTSSITHPATASDIQTKIIALFFSLTGVDLTGHVSVSLLAGTPPTYRYLIRYFVNQSNPSALYVPRIPRLLIGANSLANSGGSVVAKTIIPSGLLIKSSGPGSGYPRDIRQSFIVEDIQFRGRWSHRPGGADLPLDTFGIGVSPFKVEGYSRVVFNNVWMFDIRNKGMRCAHNNSFIASNCHGERLARGFIRSANTNDARAVNNVIKHSDDDAIDFNVTDDVGGNPSLRVVISGNTLEDTESVICNASRSVVIANNVFFRPKGSPIAVARAGQNSEDSGKNSKFSCTITGNVITDALARWDLDNGDFYAFDPNPVGGAISCAGNVPSPSLPTSNTMPGTFDGTDFVLPWGTDPGITTAGHMHLAAPTSTHPQPAGLGFLIQGNQISRTLPSGNYEDWEFDNHAWTEGYWTVATPPVFVPGTRTENEGMFTQRGWQPTPVVDANFQPNAIALGYVVENFVISDNIVHGFAGAGILLNGTSVDFHERALRHGVIEGNVIRSVKAGIKAMISSEFAYWPVLIRDNYFDIDPYCILGNRTRSGGVPTGAWNSTLQSSEEGSGIWMREVHGISVRGNSFSNCYIPISKASEIIDVAGNVLYGSPSVTGYNAGNKGIGNIPPLVDAYRYIVVDADPSSADFGKIIRNIAESGTFDALLGASGTDGTHTYSHKKGVWTRAGSIVTVHIRLEISTLNSSGAAISGNLRIHLGDPSLAFTLPVPTSTAQTVAAVSFARVNRIAFGDHIGGVVFENQKYIQLYKSISGTTSTSTALTHAELGTTPLIWCSFVYRTDDGLIP